MIKQTFYNLPETKRGRIYQAIKTEVGIGSNKKYIALS